MVEYAVDRATVGEIAEHLKRCDRDFLPSLSKRVELPGYARKIESRATRFEAWAGDRLVGLVAAYCDGTKDRTAFITSVSVEEGFRRTGIAAEIVALCIAHVAQQGLQRIELVVDSDNAAAMHLYATCGFVAGDLKGRTVTMHLDSGENSNSAQQP